MLNNKIKTVSSILILSLITSLFNLHINKEKLKNEMENLFRYLGDSIYRYQISVINTDEKDHRYIVKNKNLLLTPNESNNIKLLSENIKELIKVSHENTIIGNNLWTVANIFPGYMYIYPYKKGYKELMDKIQEKNSYFNYLLDVEKIDSHLGNDNLSVYETIKVYGPYFEDITQEELITIYYPLYNNKIVESILLLDIKYDFLHEYVMNYSYSNMTALKLSSDVGISELIFNIIAKQNNKDTVNIPINVDYKLLVLLYILCFVLYSIVFLIFHLFTRNKKDNLTGFYRKDFFKKTRKTDCIVVIDIDFFKQVNDNHGHAIGDLVISEVSRRIRGLIRKTDIPIRWGGEEFVILFDGLLYENNLATKLNDLLNIVSNEKIENLDITISIGAFITSKKINLSEAFNYADKALYESKNTGRNKYTISEYQ